MEFITVSELNRKIKGILEKDYELCDIWISGEISNFKRHSSGHLYFTIKDDSSSLRAVMFRSRACLVPFNPENGMKILARGNISVYERDGQYQLYVDELQPDGVGALHIAFEQLKDKLRQEGLFSDALKKSLPRVPKRIGIVTSPTGAAIQDILTVIKRRYPRVHIILAPVAVQGEGAPEQIAKGIELLNRLDNIDVMIVGRGGGSIEELWAFNTEIVARSIYSSKIPVVSAVGHETDFTIADFVADIRAATPSAAAELVVPDKRELERYLKNLEERLEQSLCSNLWREKSRLQMCLQSNVFKNPKSLINQSMQQLDYLNRFLKQGIERTLREKKAELALKVSNLNNLSPLSTLERGYSICQKDGQLVKSTEIVCKGDTVEVHLYQGKLLCTVQEKVQKGEK